MLIFGWMLSFVLCFAAIPAVKCFSWRIGAVDVPRDWRRMHQKSTPRAGGIAIVFGVLLSCAVTLLGQPRIGSVLGGGVLMLLLGLYDDIHTLGAYVKLFFQITIAVAATLGYGVTSPMALVAAVLWVVLLSNAHNLIDGLDGLFAGCASIEGIALCIALLLFGAVAEGQAVLCLVGSCMAFLCFNRHPANIFAGDCGSATAGFLLGMLSLPLLGAGGGEKHPMSVLLIFAYPLTDLFAAFARRTLRGQSPFSADRAHLHHRVCAAGASAWCCVGMLWCLTLAFSVLGVLLLDQRFLPLSSLLCMGIALLLVSFRRFVLKIS